MRANINGRLIWYQGRMPGSIPGLTHSAHTTILIITIPFHRRGNLRFRKWRDLIKVRIKTQTVPHQKHTLTSTNSYILNQHSPQVWTNTTKGEEYNNWKLILLLKLEQTLTHGLQHLVFHI